MSVGAFPAPALPTVHILPLSEFDQSGIAFDHDKFKDMPGPYFPAATASWLAALTQITPRARDLVQHTHFEILRGYAFLDPAIFSGNVEAKAVSKFITLWLLVRSPWLESTLR